jgi:hypothetical protein
MEFAMNRPLLQRSIRSPTGGSRVGVLAATVAAAILVKSVTLTAALAQQPGPAAEPRDQAPIGHRQPRIQDLPAWCRKRTRWRPGKTLSTKSWRTASAAGAERYDLLTDHSVAADAPEGACPRLWLFWLKGRLRMELGDHSLHRLCRFCPSRNQPARPGPGDTCGWLLRAQRLDARRSTGPPWPRQRTGCHSKARRQPTQLP